MEKDKKIKLKFLLYKFGLHLNSKAWGIKDIGYSLHKTIKEIDKLYKDE